MKDYNGQRVVILGAARQGLALARYLVKHGALVTLNDQRPASVMQAAQSSLGDLPVTWVFDGHPVHLLDNADMLCLSGGIPLELDIVREAERRGLPISNDSQIFMELVPCPVIGITGSAGKTTTTTLIGRMAQAALKSSERQAWIGGNIGQPLIRFVDEMKPEDIAVVEYSSFQLEQMTCSPTLAALLNITPNHLDRHGTLAAYTAAKAHILQFQKPTDTAVLGRDDPGAWSLAEKVRGRLISFGIARPAISAVGSYAEDDNLFMQDGGSSSWLMPRNLISLRGEHNLLNVLAACAVAYAAGFPPESMRAAVEGFRGVPHRLEFVRTFKGADWYNDSIATAPERSMAAVRSFSEPLVLLLGGRDKKLPWDELASLVRQRVDHVIAFGEAAPKILAAIGQPRLGQRPYSIDRAAGLREAIQAAAAAAAPGDIVLLAPGGTSFDEFSDFEERGERFRQWVKEL